MVANAMLGGGKRVRRDDFAAVQQMEAADAVLFNIISRRPHPETSDLGPEQADLMFINAEAARLKLFPNELGGAAATGAT